MRYKISHIVRHEKVLRQQKPTRSFERRFACNYLTGWLRLDLITDWKGRKVVLKNSRELNNYLDSVCTWELGLTPWAPFLPRALLQMRNSCRKTLQCDGERLIASSWSPLLWPLSVLIGLVNPSSSPSAITLTETAGFFYTIFIKL